MEYVGYKKIHRHKTRNTRITIVEWPGGSVTLDMMGRVSGNCWSGGSLRMTPASAARVAATMSRIVRGRKR
jgi:hypothetical protein